MAREEEEEDSKTGRALVSPFRKKKGKKDVRMGVTEKKTEQ